MMIKPLWCLGLTGLLLAGCANVPAGGAPAVSSGDALCTQASAWGAGTKTPVAQIAPTINDGDEGRSYHFDLGGKGGLQTLDASCGWGSYAECTFTARQSDGKTYQFSDLSTFGLWEAKGDLYLLYRIVSPKDEAAAGKRRIVKLGNPPTKICNQIGDYSDLM
ncbi:hypothetical protein [Xanthomonas sacchari]|nr:hypothetical protein [Xanthomonas sacchari]UYK72345.1 hypothetical protein NG828_19475 [Xanthomonas sacchari]